MNRHLIFLIAIIFNGFLSLSQSASNNAKTIENNMVLIPGGNFIMGSMDGYTDEHPAHAVFVDDFYMAKYEVTVSDFKRFIDESGYKTEVEKRGYSYKYGDNGYEEWKGITWKHDEKGNLRPSSEYDHPVIHITWNDADAYCEWISSKTGQEYHLPTEAEWEYAARSGSKEYKYSWGNGAPSGKNGENICDESLAKMYNITDPKQYWKGYHDGYVLSSPYGQFNPNSLGLYDMGGNVTEWCWDWYNESYYKTCFANAELKTGEVMNPRGPLSGDYRILRGGSFNNNPIYTRAANRNRNTPENSNNNIGFRVSST